MNHMHNKPKHVRDLLRQPVPRRFRINPIVFVWIKDIIGALILAAGIIALFFVTR